MKITFLLGFHPNQRINKRIRLLMEEHDVSVIYWQKNKDTGAYGTDIASKNTTCVEIEFNEQSLKERYFALRKFEKEVSRHISKIQPDCLYVQNLDLFLFAEKYKRQHQNKVKLVYEVSDINDMLIQPQKRFIKKRIQSYLRAAERKSCRNLDLFCYTSPAFCSERYEDLVPEDKRMYLPNIPNLSYFEHYSPLPREELTVGFVGTIRYENQIRDMLEAARIAGVHALVAGGVSSGGSRGTRVDVERLKNEYPEAEFIGAFDYPKDIASIYSKVNVSFAVYDSNLKNVRIALPNKLYEAIRCEMPIIVAPGTYLAETVELLGVGIALKNRDEIASFLVKLKEDAAFYNKYKSACADNQSIIDARAVNEKFTSWFSATSLKGVNQ